MIAKLREQFGGEEGLKNSIVVLKGGSEEIIYDDDMMYWFLQDANMWWTSGVNQPDCYSVIRLDTGETHVFLPDHPYTKKYWERVVEVEDYTKLFEIDSADIIPNMEKFVEGLAPNKIFITGEGKNPYSGNGPRFPEFSWFSKYIVNRSALYSIFNEVRLFKSDEEITLLRESARIGVEAHKYVLQRVRAGINESNVQALFRYYANWFSYEAYPPYEEICATGKNGSILHYNSNTDDLSDGDLFLMDAGTMYNRYCSDITSTFPVNGKYTDKQKAIYDIVLAANLAVTELLKPGVNWVDMQIVAEKRILAGLLELGIVQGATVDELWEKRVIYTFFPHGLGHYLGTYVHDIPGDAKFENEGRVVPKMNIRVRRTLENRMYVTVEPGIYFIDLLIKQAKEDSDLSQYYNFEKIAEFQTEVHAVRIEDDILITESGCEVFTTGLPRTTEEIEDFMAGEPTNKVAAQ